MAGSNDSISELNSTNWGNDNGAPHYEEEEDYDENQLQLELSMKLNSISMADSEIEEELLFLLKDKLTCEDHSPNNRIYCADELPTFTIPCAPSPIIFKDNENMDSTKIDEKNKRQLTIPIKRNDEDCNISNLYENSNSPEPSSPNNEICDKSSLEEVLDDRFIRENYTSLEQIDAILNLFREGPSSPRDLPANLETIFEGVLLETTSPRNVSYSSTNHSRNRLRKEFTLSNSTNLTVNRTK